ncbi:MAG: flavodoxin family protein [bacterium]|nr:flavodoxin family protein [bacterium]
MRALVINGSPRPNGSTARLCDEFARGIKDAGGTASNVCLGDATVSYCRGCDGCVATGECVIDDDMKELTREVLDCDVLVLASPSYWGDVTAQMKTFIDRSRPICEHVRGEYVGKGKRGVSIAVRAGDGNEENIHLIQCFDHYFGHLGIESAGQLTIEGVYAPQDLTGEHVEKAHELGRMVGGDGTL